MKMTPGKLAGMKAVSDERGVIAAAAMDQRGSLQKALAKERGGSVGDKEMEEFKILVTEVLTQHASAILLDPEWGIPASKRRAKGSGLLMAYEKTGYDAATPGRLPDLLDLWSVRRIKEVGADCLKILLYYAPSDPQKINDHKHAWVERIGDECRANDIPVLPGGDRLRGRGRREGPGVREEEAGASSPPTCASSPRTSYGVDVLKVEVPINMKFVEGTKCLRRDQRLHQAAGDGRVQEDGGGLHEAVHLSVSRRQQRRVHRDAGAGRRGRARVSRACCAAAQRGRTGSRSTGSRARTRSASGWRPKA